MYFEIYEGNFTSLEKKMTRIQNKCKKYGNEFSFTVLGEVYKEVKIDNEKFVAKFIQVDVTGKAIINDWEFVGTIQHHEAGNVISGITGIEFPNRYLTAPCTCEHCNRIRNRKDTYLVHNVKTDEYKQVGKSCLKDFTNGMSAEGVAEFESAIHEVEEAQDYVGCATHFYFKTVDFVSCAVEAVNHFGYVKTVRDDEDDTRPSTKSDAIKLYMYDYMDKALDKYAIQRINKYDLKADKEENIQTAIKMIDWIKNQDTESNAYLNNLKVICSDDYMEARNLGIAASLVVAYNKAMDLIKKKEEEQKATSNFQFVGEVGDKVEIKVKEASCVGHFEGAFGITYIYKFIGEDGNCYIWKTNKGIYEADVKVVKGTIKAHEEYRNCKQNLLTRCKVM